MLAMTAIGHLGQDAEVKNYSGQTVITFSVPHSKKYEKEGQQVTDTIWIQCSRWIENTRVAQYLKKGTLVCVLGEPSVRTYKNKDGIIVAQLQLRVNHIELLGGRKDETATAPVQTALSHGGQAAEIPSNNFAVPAEPVDDLPF